MDAFRDVLGWREMPVIFNLSIKKCKSCKEDKHLCLECFTKYQQKLDYNKSRFNMCENLVSVTGRPPHRLCTLYRCYCLCADMTLSFD